MKWHFPAALNLIADVVLHAPFCTLIENTEIFSHCR